MRVNDRESATSCWALRARHGADLRPEPCRLRLHQGQGLTTTLTRKPNLLVGGGEVLGFRSAAFMLSRSLNLSLSKYCSSIERIAMHT